jgi:hypothetical protein
MEGKPRLRHSHMRQNQEFVSSRTTKIIAKGISLTRKEMKDYWKKRKKEETLGTI